MKKILIINAHLKYDGIASGKLNKAFVDLAERTFLSNGCEVRITTIENGYNASEEAEKHDWADLIITQTPIYWFNAPWIHKKYIEEVFGAIGQQGKIVQGDGRTRKDKNKQYGTGGLSHGKKYLLSTTWNAPNEAFDNEKQFLFEGKSADDALINLPANYKFCGFEILSGFHCHDVIKNPQIERDFKIYAAYLEQLINLDKTKI